MSNTKKKRVRNPKRSGRSLQRQRALDVLFEADNRGIPVEKLEELLEERTKVYTSQTPIGQYGQEIVRTYAHWADDVDSMLEAASTEWSVERMSTVDRNLLRIGATEIMYLDVAVGIIVKEIADLARDLSEDKSVRFTMGVLNRVGDIRKTETAGTRGE
ncbi:MAG: transcription antitermination protein NusB [Actinomycetaceae bacterium]|nr:transcription antitermination protein NusB [Actinomycetaceae bacterium]